MYFGGLFTETAGKNENNFNYNGEIHQRRRQRPYQRWRNNTCTSISNVVRHV